MAIAPAIPTDRLPAIQQAAPESKPYQPFGSAKDLFYAKEPEVLIAGPAGTGKSRAVLEKLYACAAIKYPGMRGLMIRKTRESLTQSGMVTFEKMVAPANGIWKFRTSEQEYRFDNGSIIALGGMDKYSKVMSSEYDLIYVQEATELTEEDWESLTTRARYGVMPYNQVIADCNPSHSKHWLKVRSDNGSARMIKSEHEHNPMLYDMVQQRWTKRGVDYLKKLDNLTGVRYKRLRKGLWVSAEGLVFDTWDEGVFAMYPFEIPEEWRRIRVVDFGYVNPFVCQWWAMDNDDNMYLYKEIYMSGRTVQTHSRKILEMSEGENIEATICDHDAEDRATLEENGIPTIPANKPITVGIQAIQERMKVVNGKPKIVFFRDAVAERDEELEDQKKPTSTLDEIPDFVWSNKGKELPIQVNDHGCDTTRYAVMYVDLYSGTGGIYV